MNPFDPGDDELREWAQGDLTWPVQDFDLMVADYERAPLLVELTSSPAREFAFRCLYLVVGDAIRSDFNSTSRLRVETMLDDAEGAALADGGVRRWVIDSRELLDHPERFDYTLWCDGGLGARAALEA